MYKCPHCGGWSISVAVLFSPPFTGQTKCTVCGAELKVKVTVFSFLLPIYAVSRSTLGLLFHIRFDLGFWGEIAVLVALAFLQIGLISYKEVRRSPGKIELG